MAINAAAGATTDIKVVIMYREHETPQVTYDPETKTITVRHGHEAPGNMIGVANQRILDKISKCQMTLAASRQIDLLTFSSPEHTAMSNVAKIASEHDGLSYQHVLAAMWNHKQ